MENFLSAVRAFLFRSSTQSSERGVIGDRFRWAHEQGQDQLHLAEGGPLFWPLGMWSFDRSDSSGGKCVFVFVWSCFKVRRGGFVISGRWIVWKYCRDRRAK